MPDRPRVTIENADVTFRNFEGREDTYGKKDKRFGVRLTEEMAAALQRDGWPVKVSQPGENDEREPYPYIVVHAGYKLAPPRVVMRSSGGNVDLGEKDIQILDWVKIQTVDVIFEMGNWEVNGKTGHKAWLKTLVITIEEDDLEKKYGLNQAARAQEDIPE